RRRSRGWGTRSRHCCARLSEIIRVKSPGGPSSARALRARRASDAPGSTPARLPPRAAWRLSVPASRELRRVDRDAPRAGTLGLLLRLRLELVGSHGLILLVVHAASICTRRGRASLAFGRRTVSTPSRYSALASSLARRPGMRTTRRNWPAPRSRRGYAASRLGSEKTRS